MVHSCKVPMCVNPLSFAAALEMSLTLEDLHYSSHARDRIVRHAAATGTLAGCPELDREDEAVVEAAFVDALPAVPYDSPLWDRDDVFLDVELLATGTHPLPFAPEPPAGWKGEAPDEGWRHPHHGVLAVAGVAPVAGGSPDFEPSDADRAAAAAMFADHEPFVPSAEDWADYRQHFDQVEAPYGYE